MALHTGLGAVVRLHHGRSQLGSLEEMLSLGTVVAGAGLILTAVNLMVGRPLPGSVPVAATFLALVLMSWYRAVYRAWQERHFRWRPPTDGVGRDALDVIVFGIGRGRPTARPLDVPGAGQPLATGGPAGR